MGDGGDREKKYHSDVIARERVCFGLRCYWRRAKFLFCHRSSNVRTNCGLARSRVKGVLGPVGERCPGNIGVNAVQSRDVDAIAGAVEEPPIACMSGLLIDSSGVYKRRSGRPTAALSASAIGAGVTASLASSIRWRT